MSARSSLWLAGLAVACAALGLIGTRAHADPLPPQATAANVPPSQPPPGGAAQPPDESLLGTVDVNGSGNGLPPLPKLAVVPLISTGTADSIVNLVVRRDMELSGQFDVLDANLVPPGPFLHSTPIDLYAWRAKGAEYLLRVYAQPAPNDSIRTELVGEAYLTPAGPAPAATASAGVASSAPADPKPAFRTIVPTATTEVRAASHRLVDRLLGALTGKPGGFASEMTYAEKVGRWQRIFALDADGFDLRPTSPSDATAVSPAFGPSGQIFYALSKDYDPFRVVFGPNGTPVPMAIPGSVLGLAFSADHSQIALTVMSGGESSLWTGKNARLSSMPSAPFANHPVFGPLGKMAYVAGSPVQRIYVDGKAISPPGFMASAPVFCDTPQGLLVIYTVGVGAGADVIATDTSGGGVRRLTQHEGANTYPACSPDGRLVAFFSTGKRKAGGTADGTVAAGEGLFIMPIARPWLAKRISTEVGESLRWEILTTAAN
jgi:TolB protein